MRMKSISWSGRKAAAALAMSGIAAIAVGTVTVAAKTTNRAAPTTPSTSGKPLGPNSPDSSSIVPAKYRLVSSGFLAAPAGTQTFGRAACPVVAGVQTRPTGGGAFVSSTSTDANVNATYPDPGGTAWNAYVNNNTGTATTFDVWAICSKPKTTYIVVTNAVDNPAGAQTRAAIDCPAHDKVLGGGVLTSSTSLDVNINQSNPIQSGSVYGWDTFASNASSGDDTMTAYAICSTYAASTAGYSIIEGTGSTAPTGTQDFTSVACPIVSGNQTSVLGVGESNGSFSTAFNLNSVWPSDTQHAATWVNNQSGISVTYNAWAICAY